MSTYYVVFGALVRPDGTPSGSLARRVEGALENARTVGDARFLVSGGQGRHGPPEAEVMAGMLRAAGVAGDAITQDAESTDTLSSVRNCARILKSAGDAERVYVCSSAYHNPRCALLFRMYGIKAHIPPMPGDRQALGTGKWLYYVLREVVAIPYDVIAALFQR